MTDSTPPCLMLSVMFISLVCPYLVFNRARRLLFNGGGEGVNHVKRDWLEIFNVNCDLYLFFCVKRDWGYLRET